MVGNTAFPKQMFMAEVLQRELLSMNLVHGGAGVGDRTHLIGVELLPPVERGGDVDVHRNHPAELAIHRAGPGQPQHQVKVVWADQSIIGAVRRKRVRGAVVTVVVLAITNAALHIELAVGLIPTVHRVPHSADSGLQAHDLGFLNQDHCASPFADGPWMIRFLISSSLSIW